MKPLRIRADSRRLLRGREILGQALAIRNSFVFLHAPTGSRRYSAARLSRNQSCLVPLRFGVLRLDRAALYVSGHLLPPVQIHSWERGLRVVELCSCKNHFYPKTSFPKALSTSSAR